MKLQVDDSVGEQPRAGKGAEGADERRGGCVATCPLPARRPGACDGAQHTEARSSSSSVGKHMGTAAGVDVDMGSTPRSQARPTSGRGI